MRVLVLQCACGRNLADVTRPYGFGDTLEDPDFNLEGLVVTERPNVRQESYRPEDRLTRSRTYTWRCRCGRHPSIKLERLVDAWYEGLRRYGGAPKGTVIVNA